MNQAAKQSTMRHGCVIMASGRGTRFGGNKLMAELAEKPLVGHVLDAIQGQFDSCVVVTRHQDVARFCEGYSAKVILHDEPHRNDTVRLGVEALGECDSITFLQGDQPLISADSIAKLVQAFESDSESIWRVEYQGVPGAPMIFPAWAFDELMNLPESKGGGFLAKKYPERVRTIPVQNEYELFDVDTQEDLKTLQEMKSAPEI